jgi:hypothetical protein
MAGVDGRLARAEKILLPKIKERDEKRAAWSAANKTWKVLVQTLSDHLDRLDAYVKDDPEKLRVVEAFKVGFKGRREDRDTPVGRWLDALMHGNCRLPAVLPVETLYALAEVIVNKPSNDTARVCSKCGMMYPVRPPCLQPPRPPEYFDKCPACGAPEYSYPHLQGGHRPWNDLQDGHLRRHRQFLLTGGR